MLKSKSLSPSLLYSSAYCSDIKNLENSWLVLVFFFLIRSLICSLIQLDLLTYLVFLHGEYHRMLVWC